MTQVNGKQMSIPARLQLLQQSRYVRIIAWCSSGLALIAILCFGALIALVNSQAGHRYLLSMAQRKGADALGVPVQIQNFSLHLSTLSLDLYGVRIAGAAPYVDRPLLQADHLNVGVGVTSVFSRTWYFNQIQIDHPVAWVIVDKNGASNLPVFKNNGSNNTDLFDMGIRRVQITHGEVYFNSRPYGLTADLNDLGFNSAFSSLFKRYSGRFSYSNGNLTIGSLRPIAHNLEADFEATPTTFTLKRGMLAAGSSSAALSATVENYSNPAVHAQYQIVLDGQQAAKILNQPTMPSGSVQTAGTLQFQQAPNRSVLQALVINGDLTSARLTMSTSGARASVSNLSARYSLADGNASLANLRANFLGGELAGEGTMQAIGGNSHSSVHVDLHKVSLAQLEQSLGHAATKSVAVSGAADAQATAAWGKTIDDLVAHADLTLNGKAARPQAAPSTQAFVPIQGAFHAIYFNSNRSLSLNNSYLKSSQSNIALNGTISRQSSLSVNVQANDLSEIATFVDVFRAPAPNAAATELRGQASFHGTVRGSTSAPDLTGQLVAQNLEYSGTKWKLLSTGVALSPSRAGVQNLRLESTDRGQVAGSGGVDLREWSFSRDSAMELDLTASNMPMTTVAQIAGGPIPVTGTITASAHLHGRAIAPAGTASIRLAGASAYGEPISQARIDLTGSTNDVKVTASLDLPAGSIQAQATTNPAAKTFNATVTSSGVDLAKLQSIKGRGIDAKGVLKIRASGQGSYDDPALDADIEIPTLTMNGQAISQTKLQVNESHRVANVEIASTIASAPLHGKAQVNLQGDYPIDGSIDSPAIEIQPLLAAFAPGEYEDMTGQVELHATIHGPLKDKNQLQAQVKLPVLKLAYGNSLEIAASPIQADYRQGMVHLQPVTIRGTGTELNVQGAFPVGGSAQASLQAHGTINLKIAQLFDPDLRSSGQLKINVDSHGTNADSLLAGEIDIADANVSTTTSPVSLQHANGVLRLTSDRLTIAKLDGTLGGGAIAAQGAVIFRPDIQLNLGLAIRDAQILYPQGVRETANGNLRLTGTTRHATLGGAITLSNLSFTPAFDLSSIVDQLSGGVEVPSGPGFQQNLQLNIAVNSTNDTSLVSRSLSVDGTANLQIRGTAAEPVVLGRVNLTGGDVILNGNRFVLTGGTVQFINPAMTEPVLNVGLTTNIKEYKIDLRFRGPADQMRTQYTSNPSLPPADIINLLAFGQTTEASAANATPLNQQAEGLVASQVSSQVTSRVSKAAGISQLSISPVLAGGTTQGPAGANLTIQQRVTGNLFVTFSTNVATTQGQTIQGQYQVSPRVTFSATRDPNGGFAVGTLIKKSW